MMADVLRRRVHDELKWSYRTVARETGLHYEMVRKLISGETQDPRLSTMVKLARGLDMSLDELAELKTAREPTHG